MTRTRREILVLRCDFMILLICSRLGVVWDVARRGAAAVAPADRMGA